jgi:hypothetical protein
MYSRVWSKKLKQKKFNNNIVKTFAKKIMNMRSMKSDPHSPPYSIFFIQQKAIKTEAFS